MRKVIYIFTILVIIFTTGCEKEEVQVFHETGTILDFSESLNCGFLIKLDNGQFIKPLYYPEEFIFAEGKRVFVEYTQLPNVLTDCNKGIGCEIKYIEELGCTEIIGITSVYTDTLGNDGVSVKQTKMDGKCLLLMLSYSGGCREHKVSLVIDKPLTKTSSEIPVLEIRHNGNNDMCEAWLTKEYAFDMSMLLFFGKSEILLRSKNPDGSRYEKKISIH